MSNLAQAVSRQITVPFHGAELYVVERNNQPYTPMKPIVEGMGLDWGGQHKKLAANQDRWGVSVMEIPSAGGVQDALCLPLRKLGGWLMTVHASRVRPEIRDRIVQYQNECDDVLWQYWNEGIAINPRVAYSVNPSDVLTADQQETLRLMVKTLAEKLPKAKQGSATIKTWSKLKAHFKVPYRQIPQSEFTEAVSIVTRTAAEWEVVTEQPIAVPHKVYHYPISSADPHDRKFGNAWMTPRVLTDPMNRAPELELMAQLESNGHNVTGAKIRILALRDVAIRQEQMRATCEALAHRFESLRDAAKSLSTQYGKNVQFRGTPNPDDPIDRHVYGDQM
jgi:hypothetical protein